MMTFSRMMTAGRPQLLRFQSSAKLTSPVRNHRSLAETTKAAMQRQRPAQQRSQTVKLSTSPLLLGGRGKYDNRPKSSNVGVAALGVGQISVAGGALAGLGSLCYYGLGFSGKAGAIDEAVLWPAHVRARVRDVYMYFASSLAATAGATYAISQSPELMRLVSTNGVMGMVATIAAMVATSVLCHSIPYEPGFGAKQLAWLLHTSVIGAVVAPLTMLGGPVLVRAAVYTAGICGGLSCVAMCAPSDQFLSWGGPLACGFGVVFLASIGSAFLPPTGAAGE